MANADGLFFKRDARKHCGRPPSAWPGERKNAASSLMASVSGRLTFCKMSNAARENRVFADGRAADGKFAMLARRSWDKGSAESGFCLTGARW